MYINLEDRQQSTTMHVSVERAIKWLEGNSFKNQRPVRAKYEYYADEMRNGRFGPSAIQFARLPNDAIVLIDGQHRLHAIVHNQKGFPFTVIETLVDDESQIPDLYATIDNGLKRTPSDQMQAYGLVDKYELTKTQINRLVSSIQYIRVGFRPLRQSEQISPLVLERTLEHEWIDIGKQYYACFPKSRKSGMTRPLYDGFMRKSVMSIGLLTFKHESSSAKEFWTEAMQPTKSETSGHPSIILREHLKLATIINMTSIPGRETTTSGYRIYTQRTESKRVARCWNAFYQGKELRRIQRAGDSDTVPLLGVPEKEGAIPSV